jgi:hypothetical protein
LLGVQRKCLDRRGNDTCSLVRGGPMSERKEWRLDRRKARTIQKRKERSDKGKNDPNKEGRHFKRQN